MKYEIMTTSMKTIELEASSDEEAERIAATQMSENESIMMISAAV